MKLILSALIFIIINTNLLFAQIDYFGQELPGDSAIVFSPDFISAGSRFIQGSSFTPDGKEFSFTTTNSGWSLINVMNTQYVDGQWTEPAVPDFLKTNLYREWGLRFSPDSKRYFVVGEEKAGGGSSIYYGERSNDGWGKPIKISALGQVSEPSVSSLNTVFLEKVESVFLNLLMMNTRKSLK